jgi:hypothetical protein
LPPEEIAANVITTIAMTVSATAGRQRCSQVSASARSGLLAMGRRWAVVVQQPAAAATKTQATKTSPRVPFPAARTGHFYWAQTGHFHVAVTRQCPIINIL